jgi:hypothetical protein
MIMTAAEMRQQTLHFQGCVRSIIDRCYKKAEEGEFVHKVTLPKCEKTEAACRYLRSLGYTVEEDEWESDRNNTCIVIDWR